MIDSINDTYLERCPICSFKIKLWRIKDTEFGKFKIDRCVSCGYAFVNPRPSIRFLKEFYATSGHGDWTEADGVTASDLIEREKKFPNSTKDAQRIIATANALGYSGQERRLLDVGCGYGFFTREALANGFSVDAIELASKERGLAHEMTGLEPKPTTFEDYEHDGDLYSIILMSQILEHAQDVVLWVEKARSLLVDGGGLIIAVPNFDGIFRRVMQENEPYIIPPAHLNYFGSKNLSLLLEAHGFEVEKVQWVSRIMPTAFEKRFSWAGKSVLSTIQLVSSGAMNTIDLLRMGLFINVYAKKRPS